MSTERLTKRLQELGLEKNEAELYVFLSAMGPSPARIVSRRFNLNRMKAYRNLKTLEDKGLVQSLMGRPIRYVATPLIEVLNKQKGGLKQRLTDLEQNSDTLIEEWKNLANGAAQPTDEEFKFRIFQGRQQIFDLLLEMCDKAEEEVRLVTTTRDLARLSLWGIDDRFRALTQKGKKVRVLTQIDVEGLENVKPYLALVEARHVTLSAPIRFAIIDGRETLTTVAMDDSMSMTTKADTGLWTNASSYVAAMRIFFDALWSLAPEAESMIRFIQTGEPSQEIITYMTNEEYSKLFRDMIGRSTITVDIMANDLTALPLPLDEIDELTVKGVKTRVLTKTNPKNLPYLAKIAGEDLIIAENAALTDLILLTIDAKEVLMNVPYMDLQKRTVWSNISAYVETMLLMFRDYWQLGQPIQEKLKQVAQRIRVETLATKIRDALEDEEWFVEVPGTLHGAKSYNFDVLAKNQKKIEASLCIDVLTDGSVFNRIVERSSFHSDLKSARYVIASLIPPNSEELRLAELYQIHVLYAETEEGLISSILKLLK
jgi:sugar-specific transcriptional regulator TrmB